MVKVCFLMTMISIFGTIDRIIDDVVIVETDNSKEIYLDVRNFDSNIFEGAVLNMDLTVNFIETRRRADENLKIIKTLIE